MRFIMNNSKRQALSHTSLKKKKKKKKTHRESINMHLTKNENILYYMKMNLKTKEKLSIEIFCKLADELSLIRN